MARSSTEAPQALSIKKNMLFNTVGSLMYQGCLWLTTVLVVTLASGYDDSGALAYAMTIGNMFNAVGTYSMRTYQVSDSKNENSQQNYIAFRLVTLMISLVVMGVYTAVVTNNPASLVVTLAYLPFKFDEAFADVLYGIDQKAERMDYIGVSQVLRGVLVIASFCVGMAVARSLVVAVLLMFPACLLVTLAYDLPHAHRFGPVRPSITASRTKKLLVSCLPIVLSTLFLGMIVSVARQYFGNAFGNDMLGHYAAVATPAVLVQAAARYLYAPALVPLADKWSANPRAEFWPFFKRTLLLMAAAMAAMVVVLALLGPWALTVVYGESIADYTYLFTNVLVCTATIALLYYATDTLVVCRDINGALIAATIALGTSLALMVPLEGAFGMQGINYTVIAACLAGLVAAFVRILLNPKLRA